MVAPASENPFAAPPDEASEPPASSMRAPSDASPWPIAQRTFMAWESLRIAYLAVLIPLTVVIGSIRGVVWTIEFWAAAVIGGVAANLFYFAGPAIETYAVWLGYRGWALRYAMFLSGLLFATALAFVTLTQI